MMKTLMLLAALCLSLPALAGDYVASTQFQKDGQWTPFSSWPDKDYMKRVLADCNAAMIIKPHAVKIRFPNGEEKTFLCDEIRAQSLKR